MSKIELKAIRKAFGKKVVLDGIDLSIDKRNAVLLAIGLADGDAVSLTLDLAQQVRIDGCFRNVRRANFA